MYQAKILLDSVNPAGHRLTTWELTYPRFVHAELMTHRVFSRNSASSRAIPSEKLIQRILDDPAMPVFWGKNQPGMQANEEISDTPVHLSFNAGFGPSPQDCVKSLWIEARDKMIKICKEMQKFELHKQIANRILEPWMYITVILSATTFDNWFNLRCHKDAQPEIKHLADMMKVEYEKNIPVNVDFGDWHLPLIMQEDFSFAKQVLANTFKKFDSKHHTHFATELLKKVSVGRCARVSYLTHDGKRDLQADIDLHDRLVTSGHWSPFEHVAMAAENGERYGNFKGWIQYRKSFANESGE